jgi:hypothetical protein
VPAAAALNGSGTRVAAGPVETDKMEGVEDAWLRSSSCRPGGMQQFYFVVRGKMGPRLAYPCYRMSIKDPTVAVDWVFLTERWDAGVPGVE